jgi:hypothetical protein
VPVLVGVPEGVGYPLPKEWEEQSTGTSDAEGRAHLPHVDAEAVKGLDIVPPGEMGMLRYGQNHFLNIRPRKEGDQHFEFELPETGSVTGQLVVSPGFDAAERSDDHAGVIHQATFAQSVGVITVPSGWRREVSRR